MGTQEKPALSQGLVPASANQSATPMMVQYLAIKQAHADYLLFYRMGDFYELFFDDAVQASAALDIALTKRGKHLDADIAMCGVPVHSAEGYLLTLIRKGFKVAICEQTEDPAEARKRGSKSVVAREVVRVVTPGTLTEDQLLVARRHNYLAALAQVGGVFGVAWVDISDGVFHVISVEGPALQALIARVEPAELLVPQGAARHESIADIVRELGPRATIAPNIKFDSEAGERLLKSHFKVVGLDAFGSFSRAEIAAAGAVLAYLELTQKGQLPALRPPRQHAQTSVMAIDAATRRNLELVETLSGGTQGSLLATIDRTLTSAGGRELADWIQAPLSDVTAINARLDGVEHFSRRSDARDTTRGVLRRMPDIARALARLSAGRGGPRDLGAIREGLAHAFGLVDAVTRGGDELQPVAHAVDGDLRRLSDAQNLLAPLAQQLMLTLGPDLPLLARDGGYIASGAHQRLDEAKRLRDDARRFACVVQRDVPPHERRPDDRRLEETRAVGGEVEGAGSLLGRAHRDERTAAGRVPEADRPVVARRRQERAAPRPAHDRGRDDAYRADGKTVGGRALRHRTLSHDQSA